MKTIIPYPLRIFIYVGLLFIFNNTNAQKTLPFQARYKINQTIQLDTLLVKSDTIYLKDCPKIFSLSIYAVVKQPIEKCFLRILLEDSEGIEYIVTESDRFRNDSDVVNLQSYCEETSKLNGIVPNRLKIYMTNNVEIFLSAVHLSYSADKSHLMDKYADNIRKCQVQDIVNNINNYNKIHKKHWMAGVTGISLLSYESKKHLLITDSVDSYLNNMQYYVGGLYEVGTPTSSDRDTNSPFIESFDWRNRHGKNWLTPVKNQFSSGYCTAFAAVGMLEANMNLFYNRILNLDLSEQYVASYGGVSFNHGASRGRPIRFLKTDGTIDDLSMPFVNDSNYVAPTVRPIGEEHVYLNDYYSIYLNSLPLDSLKKYIINKGPGVCGYRRSKHPYTHENDGGHAMTLVGYGVIVPDTTYVFFNGNRPYMVFQEGDSLIGHTYWIYKNSWGPYWGHNGYMYITYYNDDNWYMGRYAYFPKGKPVSNVDRYVLCEDFDGDGYFNWGIGPKPDDFPSWAETEEDGDDSNCLAGPMNQFGYCETLSENRMKYYYIEHDTILSEITYPHSHYIIWKESATTINNDLEFQNGVKLIVDKNSTLIIDGAKVQNVLLRPMPGSNIIIKNGGRIIFNKTEAFKFPIGANLRIISGAIE